VKVWPGFKWLRIGYSGRLLVNTVMNLGFNKLTHSMMRDIL
jgi:hypothetical protein